MNSRAILPAAVIFADQSAVYDEIAGALDTARAYAEIGVQASELRDSKALAYAVRCASAALLTAASLTEQMRPSRQAGRDGR